MAAGGCVGDLRVGAADYVLKNLAPYGVVRVVIPERVSGSKCMGRKMAGEMVGSPSAKRGSVRFIGV